MYDVVIKELRRLQVDDTQKYALTMHSVRDFCIQFMNVIKEAHVELEPVKSEERKQLLDANIKIMDMYKETFTALKILVDYLNGEEIDKKVFFDIVAKYKDAKMFSDSVEDDAQEFRHITVIK